MTPLRSVADLRLTETARLVYAAICELDGEASYAEIARLVRKCRRTVIRAVASLEKAGAIVRVTTSSVGKAKSSNRYELPLVTPAVTSDSQVSLGSDVTMSPRGVAADTNVRLGGDKLMSPGSDTTESPHGDFQMSPRGDTGDAPKNGHTSLLGIYLSPPMGPPLSSDDVEPTAGGAAPEPPPGGSSASPPPPNPRPSSVEASEPQASADRQLDLLLVGPARPARKPAKAPAEPKRKTRCPSSTDPDAPAWLAREGIPPLGGPLGAEVAKMLDHHAARGNLFLSWPAVWRTWDKNADAYGKRAHGPAPGQRRREEPAPERRPDLAPPSSPALPVEANARAAADVARNLAGALALGRPRNSQPEK